MACYLFICCEPSIMSYMQLVANLLGYIMAKKRLLDNLTNSNFSLISR